MKHAVTKPLQNKSVHGAIERRKGGYPDSQDKNSRTQDRLYPSNPGLKILH